MIKYSNKDLQNIINKIHSNKKFLCWFKLEKNNWSEVTKFFFHYFPKEGIKDIESQIKNYSALWRRFANDFINEKFKSEYNSSKHGFRATRGGFALAIGLQDKPDIPAPPEKMKVIGSSKYGSSFFITDKVGEQKINFRLKRLSRNWDPENFSHALNLISISIHNIKSFLLIFNKIQEGNISFRYVENEKYFEEPWARIPGVSDSMMEFGFSEDFNPEINSEDILNMYTHNKKNT